MSSASDIERELVSSVEDAPRFDPWKLRLLRAKAGVDLRRLSEAARLGRNGHTSLCRYEGGRTVPPPAVVEELALALSRLGCGEVVSADLLSAPGEQAENASKHARWKSSGRGDIAEWLAKAANRSAK